MDGNVKRRNERREKCQAAQHNGNCTGELGVRELVSRTGLFSFRNGLSSPCPCIRNAIGMQYKVRLTSSSEHFPASTDWVEFKLRLKKTPPSVNIQLCVGLALPVVGPLIFRSIPFQGVWNFFSSLCCLSSSSSSSSPYFFFFLLPLFFWCISFLQFWNVDISMHTSTPTACTIDKWKSQENQRPNDDESRVTHTRAHAHIKQRNNK